MNKKLSLLAKATLCCSLLGVPSIANSQELSPTATTEVYDFSKFSDTDLMELFYNALQNGRKYPTPEEFEAKGILQSDIAFIRSHVRRGELLSREDRLIQNTNANRNLWMNIPMSKGKGGAVGHPNTTFMEDTYSMWNYTNLFGSWNHSFFTAPGAWVDAAHKNGTDIFSGIKFFDTTGGDMTQGAGTWMNVISAKNTDGTFKYVEPLINCLMYFGSDGINYNWEASGYSDSEVIAFNQALYKKAAELGFTNFHMGMYTNNSTLSSYNSKGLYGDANGQTADLMLNYMSGDFTYSLASSVQAAKAATGSADRLYAGVWIVTMNRGWSRLDNTADAKECNLCLWGEHDQSRFWSYNSGADAYQAQGNYQKLLERAFSGGNRNPLNRPAVSDTGNEWEGDNPLGTFAGLATWIPERSTIKGSLPFATYFNIGNGDRYNYKGKKTAGSWYNMANQDRVPTYRWLVTNAGNATAVSTAIQPEFSHDDAYTGGSCLKLTGNSSTATDIVLYKTDLTAGNGAYANIAVKTGLAGENPTDLYVIVKKADGTWVETPVGNTTGNTWEEKKVNLSLASGDAIKSIGLRVKGSNSNYKLYVGKLEINDEATKTPANITDMEVEVKQETKTSLSLKLNWKLDKAATERANWDLLYNDEANIDHFEVLYKNGENGRISEVGRTTQWAAYVGDIQFESESDEPYVGVRAVSTDLKTYSPVVWQKVDRADQSALPDAVEEDTYGISQIDPSSAGIETARAYRYLTDVKTSGATTDLNYKATGPQTDGTQYVRVKDQKLVVQQGQTVQITLIGCNENNDGLKYCFGGGWLDLDGSGTFNPDKIQDNPAEGEQLFFAGKLRGSTPEFQSAEGYTTSFTVPADACTGKSRLRIVFSDAWFAGTFLPTGLTAKGFSIDFDVEIQGSNPSRPKPADNHDQGEADEPEGLESSAITSVASPASSFFAANNILNFSNTDKAWIYNANGSLVKFVSHPTTVDVNDFANGVYIVRMQSGKVIRSGKFVR